jgi:enoyl-CoA hydratase
MAKEPHLLVHREGPIVTVTMNRPEIKNALSSEMLARMADAWFMIDKTDEVRVAILTGAGGTFCAGADLKAMAKGDFGEEEWVRRFDQDPDLQWKALLKHYRLKKPLIAAVEGYAIAGGSEILQATDIRVAGEGAKFGVSEVKWGLYPLGGSAVRLRRQIPYTIAADILLTGRHFTAEEALRIGLIGRVVPKGEALAEAKKIATQIAENGPLAVQAVLKTLQLTDGLPETAALQIDLEVGSKVFLTEDAKEGPRSFVEKRKPSFQGK